jgi:hypothetical protein
MNAGAAPGQSFAAPSAPAARNLGTVAVDVSGRLVGRGSDLYAVIEQQVTLERGRTL